MAGHRASLAALLTAGPLATALVATQLWLPAPAPVTPYPHEPSFGTTAAMLLMVPALTAWGVSISHRCSDDAVRRYLTWADALMVLWQIVALCKYAAMSDWLVAALWYAYYLPLALVPLMLLFCALRTTGLDRRLDVRRVKVILVALGLALFAAVATNGLHHLAFVFDATDPRWDVNYGYGPVYRLAFAWVVATCGASLALPLVFSHARIRHAVNLVLLGLVAAIAYALLYVLRVRQAFQSNFALTFSVIYVVLVEACLETGVYPSSVHVTRVFRSLPLDLRVLDPHGEDVIRSRGAGPLDAGARAEILARWPADGEPATFRSRAAAHVTRSLWRVNGGAALLSEDMRAVDRRRSDLARKRERLSRQRAFLERARNARHELTLQASQRQLADEVGQSLQSTCAQIRQLLRDLPAGTDDASRELRRHQLLAVKLLVAYCKRKGALVAGPADGLIDPDQLRMVLNETMADVRTARLDCAATVMVDHALPARVVNVLYDCIYDFVLCAFEQRDVTLLVVVSSPAAAAPRPRGVELRIALETPLRDRCALTLAREMRLALERRGIGYQLDDDEGVMRLRARIESGADVTAPREGARGATT